MAYTDIKPRPITPRIILHGGAGNIARSNLPKESYKLYRAALLNVVEKANDRLAQPGATALDIATYAVAQLENNGLFNAGHGAVYTTAGTHELEASVMVSKGYRKRGVGVLKVNKAKNPIKLAREMLVRGERDDGDGAGQHVQLHGDIINNLATQWGLECVKPSYYWTRSRWDEHRRGLGLEHSDETYENHKSAADGESESIEFNTSETASGTDTLDGLTSPGSINWNGRDYLPQGTVGAVVLDSTGTLCVATSTGGLTNKLPGRIGDTPTLGAGFFAEEWHTTTAVPATSPPQWPALLSLASLIKDCLPKISGYNALSFSAPSRLIQSTRATAVSGTGNGDSFLRVNAVRTASAIARFSPGSTSLQDAVTAVAGPHGILQQSAGEHWKKTGEGEGGIIGIELTDGKGTIVADFNCGGMFRAWVDEDGKSQMAVFRQDYY